MKQLFAIVRDSFNPNELPIGAIVEIDLSKCGGEGSGLDNFIMAPNNGWVPIWYKGELFFHYKDFLHDFWLV